MKYTAQELKNWDASFDAGTSGWLPERSENHRFEGFISRIRNAWGVIKGDYDVVDWYSYDKNKRVK